MSENEKKDPKEAHKQRKLQDLPRQGLTVLFSELFRIVKLIWSNLKDLALRFMNIEDSTDVEGTITSIKNAIYLKGYNIWILICSAILACIGLDTNSAAVIIGAMLISPLMSPILGLGLSVGINDRHTLQDALYNFGVAVAISLGTAFLYFLITPLGRETPEMAARTAPTLLDVGVGFFGGIAGIVAGSRKDKTNAIPGVAIATALMPPICVAGFGLAKFNLPYFGGAFYLFFLNATFIAFSTFMIVRLLKFPVAENITESVRRKFFRGTVFAIIVILVPSTWIFIRVIQKANTDSRVSAFLTEVFDDRPGTTVDTYEYTPPDSLGKKAMLFVAVQSRDFFPQDSVEKFQELLNDEYGMPFTVLELNQTKSDPSEMKGMEDRINENFEAKLQKFNQEFERRLAAEEKIAVLEDQIAQLKKDTLPLLDIRKEVVDWTDGLRNLWLGRMEISDVRSDGSMTDGRLYTVLLNWNGNVPKAERRRQEGRILKRLKKRLGTDQVKLMLLGPEPPDPSEMEEEVESDADSLNAEQPTEG